MSYRLVLEGFDDASVADEISRHLTARGWQVHASPAPPAPDDFRLSPEVASIVVSGIGVLSAVIGALLAYLSARRNGTIVLVGKSGRRIEIPKDTSVDEVGKYIALAKGLDDLRHIAISADAPDE